MGEVYRARDSKLKRDVAIKVLPEAFARDPERLARFEREAEVLATLNHPNIAAVYGFEESADANGIVLELVEGPTLADSISRGPIPIDEALPIARQIVEAMIAAHERGIVHRDLKPANIKITPGGQVKVLDFGLAKAADTRGIDSGINVTALPTITSPAMMTGVGVVLGTAAYMSPEQARGRAVDGRADIWAFGAVLYEMLTGCRAFPGDDVTETIANIVKSEPDWNALRPETSVAVRALLRRCLHKDPDRRLRHIADARFNLEDAETLALPASRLSRPTRMVPWAVAACSLAAAAALAWMLWGRAPRASAPVAALARLEVNLPPDIEMFTTNTRTVALSPDGSKLAFIGVRAGSRFVYVRPLGQFDATPVKDTDGATLCFFSPDGKSIGVMNAGGVLKTTSLVDGLTSTITENANFLYGAAWLPDGTIAYARNSVLWRIARGGASTQMTTLDIARNETAHAWPMGLPGGKRMLFAVAVGDRWHIESLDLTSGARTVVVETGTLPLVVVNGRLVFFREGELLAAPFDEAAGRLTGSAERMIGNLATAATGVPMVDVSASGTMVYASTSAVSRLVWVSRAGVEQPANDVLRAYSSPRLSPDGTRVVVSAGSLWLQDLARATFTRLSQRDDGANAFPLWSEDGQRVYARSGRGLTVFEADGSGRSRVIPTTSDRDYPAGMAGDTIIVQRSSPDTSFDIFAISLKDPSNVRTLVKTPAYEGGGQLSPDGKWLSYISNESGRNEVYVRPYSGPDRRWPVSTQGGTQATWNRNGKEIFYREGNRMMAVAVSGTSDLTLSQPQLLFERRYAFGAGITVANYDLSKDGQRFLMVKDEAGAGRLNIVLNAFSDLK
jgi:Tol biopolymer transport system component